MRTILALILLFFIISCSDGHRYITHHERYTKLEMLASKLNHKLQTSHAHIIIKYDLLGIDGSPINHCPVSKTYYSLLKEENLTHAEFEEKLLDLEFKITSRLRSDAGYKRLIDSNAKLKASKLKFMFGAKYNKQSFLTAKSHKNSDVFSVLEKDKSIQKKSFKDPLYELADLTGYINSIPVLNPLPGSVITSDFGIRNNPITKKRTKHNGIDLQARNQKNVYVTADGKVRVAGIVGKYGKLIIIDHGNGFSTRYAHLDHIYVEVGQQVFLGQVIGVEGNTGNSTNHHLHYEVRFNEQPQNPRTFLEKGKGC